MRTYKIALFLVFFGFGCNSNLPHQEWASVDEKSGPTPRVPIPIPIRWSRSEIAMSPLATEEWASIQAKFRPKTAVLGWGKLLHHLENCGPEARFAQAEGSMDGPTMMGLITRGDTHPRFQPSDPLFFRDSDGVARLTRSTLEFGDGHQNQPLVAFASLGLTGDTRLISESSETSIGELISLAQAEFHLKNEIDWSIIALARYVPTRSSWKNRWGAVQSFDRIVEEILHKPRGGGSCGGTHLLYALCVIIECDRVRGLLSSGVRERAMAHLRETTCRLDANIRPDGYWTKDWPFGLVDPDSRVEDSTFSSRTEMVQVTGHHLEWLQIAPDGVQINPNHRRSAILWCSRALREVGEIGPNELCPYSHCFRVVSRYLAPQQPTTHREIK